ncbi:MAG: putative peptidoglycan lipid II flippase [Limisphaerales bacterium]|jgi:putative peptidoglycan lipid II flippase
MLGAVSTVTGFAVASQFIGFLRMAIIAYAFGLSTDVDAYYLGLAIPTLVILVFSNWAQLSYLGRYTTLVVEDNQPLARAFRLTMLLLVALLATLTCVLGFVFPEIPIQFFLNATATQEAAAIVAFQWTVLIIAPSVVADFMGQSLNGHRNFAVPAAAQLANAVVATLALWLSPSKGIESLVGSLIFGALVQLAIVAVPFMRLRSRKDSGKWPHSLIKAELRVVFRLTLYIVPAVILSNAVLSILQFNIAQFGDGAVSTMGYANRINSAIGQLLVIGLGTVLLPHFAALIAKSELGATQYLFRRLVRGSILVSSIVVALVFLIGESWLSILLDRGAFDEAAVAAVHHLLVLLSFALLPMAIGTFIARYFSALRRADFLLFSGLIAFVCVFVVAKVGAELGSIQNIALAPTVAFSATTVFWLWKLAQVFPLKPMLSDAIRATLTSLALIATISVLNYALFAYYPDLPEPVLTTLRTLALGTTLIFLLYASGTLRWVLEPYANHINNP